MRNTINVLFKDRRLVPSEYSSYHGLVKLLGCDKNIEKNAKRATGWHSNPNYSTSTEPIPMQSSTSCSQVFLTSLYQSQFLI